MRLLVMFICLLFLYSIGGILLAFLVTAPFFVTCIFAVLLLPFGYFAFEIFRLLR